MTLKRDPEYAMGRNDAETQRLIDQEVVYGPSSRAAFREAGIGPGMKVLDIGTGPGSLALMAAEFVGPTGSVVGVDSDPKVLETARLLTERACVGNVTFLLGDFRTMDLPDDFDAIVGRYVLMYQADPAGSIRDIIRHLKPGGIVVFQDWQSDLFGDYFRRNPGLRTCKQLCDWAIETFTRAGIDTNFGPKMASVLLDAGFSQPSGLALTIMGGPDDWAGFKFFADTLRSLVPLMEKYGVATAAEADVDTIADRLREEARRERALVPVPTPFSVWATKSC